MRKINIAIIALGEIVKIIDIAMGVIIGGVTTSFITESGDFASLLGTDMIITLGIITGLYLILRIVFAILKAIVDKEEVTTLKKSKSAGKTVGNKNDRKPLRVVRRNRLFRKERFK